LIQFFPDVHPVLEPEYARAIIDAFRPIGYINLLVVIILIVVGFLIKNDMLTVTGSFYLFLPTFGGFAVYMFFLAGIGILEVLWIPLDTPFFNFLTLGSIVFIPAFPLILISPYPICIGSGIVMFIGLYIFTLGVISWFYGKYQKKEIIDFSIYKYSRHPQYLGFLIWSYGLYMQYMTLEIPLIMIMGRIGLEASLPWVVMALVTIGVAFIEDINMSKKDPESFREYRKKTPFLINLPPNLESIITSPMRYIIKKDFPETKKEVLKVLFFYGVIIALLSLPIALPLSILL
jgi:protein-S-isoprenylcysteine O-methyltransferase Ste14